MALFSTKPKIYFYQESCPTLVQTTIISRPSNYFPMYHIVFAFDPCIIELHVKENLLKLFSIIWAWSVYIKAWYINCGIGLGLLLSSIGQFRTGIRAFLSFLSMRFPMRHLRGISRLSELLSLEMVIQMLCELVVPLWGNWNNSGLFRITHHNI